MKYVIRCEKFGPDHRDYLQNTGAMFGALCANPLLFDSREEATEKALEIGREQYTLCIVAHYECELEASYQRGSDKNREHKKELKQAAFTYLPYERTYRALDEDGREDAVLDFTECKSLFMILKGTELRGFVVEESGRLWVIEDVLLYHFQDEFVIEESPAPAINGVHKRSAKTKRK